MRVLIHNLYTNGVHEIRGNEFYVRQELVRLYPFLRVADPAKQGSARALAARLGALQALDVEVQGGEEEPVQKAEPRNPGDEGHVVAAMLGHRHDLEGAMAAARFLAGGAPAPTPERVRQALREADGDVEEAALMAHGLEPSEAHLRALRAFRSMSPHAKAEPAPPPAQSVQAGAPDAEETAEEIDRAFRDGFVVPVELRGKHSKGSLLARDQGSGRTWLLKPGSGQIPSAGAREDLASQSRREVAFWHVADAWRMGSYYPRADLLLVGGREYAAIQLLPWSFETLDRALKVDPGRGRAVLAPYLKDGVLHRWAVIDAVLGNPDRHASNIMVRGADVRLVDHGSSMAGEGFDPAHDRYSFTPYYLRAWYTGRWPRLDAATKLKAMPRVDRATEEQLRAWLDQLQPADLDKVLLRYGVNPGPAKERLARLKTTATQMPVDLAINRFWVEV